jgi:lipopolysaccharide export system protein LptC
MSRNLARELRLTQPRLRRGPARWARDHAGGGGRRTGFRDDDVIVTDQIEGRIAVSDDGYVLLDAGAGRIDMARRVADLSGGVEAETTQGYRIASDTMRVSLAELGMTRRNACASRVPGLTLEAGAMVLEGPDGAAVLSFTGGVRLLYEPEE